MTHVTQGLKQSNKHRLDIQVLRGIAVLAVLLFHTQDSVFTVGYLGVDVFFVVSGFVVTPLLSRIYFDESGVRTRDSLSRLHSFYIRRFYRLAPALGVSLVIAFFVILLLGPVSDHSRFAKQGLAALFLLGNVGAYRYSGGNYFAPNPNPLIHLWSLSVEEQIYFVLPIVIFSFFFIIRRWQKSGLYLIILTLGALAYILDTLFRLFPEFLQNYGVTDVPGLMFYSPTAGLWKFCIGSCSYILSTRLVNSVPISHKYINWPLIVILCFSLFLPLNALNLQPVLICFFTAVALYFRSFEHLPRSIRSTAVWLGDRSYSIYLVHMPILHVAIYCPLFVDYRAVAALFGFTISIVLGSTIYRKVEERFRLESLGSGSAPVRTSTILICFVVIPILLFTLMRDGVANHYWGRNPNPIPPVYSVVDDPNCYLEISPCSYPSRDSISDTLLIGDSHAAAIFQTFAGTMNSMGVSAYGMQKAGCQFILPRSVSREIAKKLGYSILRPGDKQTCFSHNNSIVQWIESNPDATVFISQRSSSIRPKGIDEKTFRKIVLRNLIYLKEISANLIVIGPNPEFPDPRGIFQGSLLLWQEAYIPPKILPITEMIGEPTRDNDFLNLKTPLHGISYIDSLQPFCTKKACTRFENSIWLFYDSEHLTPQGVSKLQPQIREQMRLTLGR